MSIFNRAELLKFTDATLGALLCRVLGSAHHRLHDEPVPGPIQRSDVRRVLVIRPGGMGDMIVLIPVLKRLQEALPGAELTLVCERRNLDVLRLAGLEAITRVYDRRPFLFLALLREQRFDIAIDTEQFHHFSTLFAWWSRAPVRIGFKINPLRNPLYTHLVSYATDGAELNEFARLLAPLGLSADGLRFEGCLADRSLPVPASVDTAIAHAGGTGRFAAIHPGASTPFKVWPTDRFAELARRLQDEHGVGTVLLGGGDSQAAAATVANDPGLTMTSRMGPLDLEQTAAVIRAARVFIGSDSGLGHLAVALGVPTVVLFGPSDPLKWGWTGPRHAVVSRHLPCAPCFIFGYHKPCRRVACMTQLDVPAVLEAVRTVLR